MQGADQGGVKLYNSAAFHTAYRKFDKVIDLCPRTEKPSSGGARQRSCSASSGRPWAIEEGFILG